MKAKQLIDLIRENFHDDEEVTFLTADEWDVYRATKAVFRIHTRETPMGKYIGHNRKTGQWEDFDIDSQEHREDIDDVRFLKTGGVRIDSRKVLDICGYE